MFTSKVSHGMKWSYLSKKNPKHEEMRVSFFHCTMHLNTDTPDANKVFNLGQTSASVICPLRFYSEAHAAVPSPTPTPGHY